MANNLSASVLAPTTLDPLPDVLRHGLVAVSVCGLLSLAASLSLFAFLTARLCMWYRRGQLQDGANQFLLLVYNLLLADIQQAMAFALTTVYLATDQIQVGTTTCWANGWFVSTGDLASGVFILAIALHTFYAVVRGRQVSTKVFFWGIAGLWTFVYLMAIIGVAMHPDLYVRAGAWCWINRDYAEARLWLHYFWIFVCMFGCVVVYGLIFLSIHTQAAGHGRGHGHDETRHRPSVPGQYSPAVLKRAAKYMVIYPVVYVVCTLPLAGGRMASMTGIVVPYWWYCLAGAAITSCGWLDVLLYAVTRRALIFSVKPPAPDRLGLDTFGWHYAAESFWGTTTTVSGPLGPVTERCRHSLLIHRPKSSRRPRKRSNETEDEEDEMPIQPLEGVISTETTFEVTSGEIPPNVHLPTPRLECTGVVPNYEDLFIPCYEGSPLPGLEEVHDDDYDRKTSF